MNPADAGRPVSSTMRRDVLSAYAASGAKVLSWVIVSAIVFRAHPFQYAVLALVRGTVALLNYTTLGLAPAMVRLLAEARAEPPRVLPVEEPRGGVLPYATVGDLRTADDRTRATFAAGVLLGGIAGLIGLAVTTAYAFFFRWLHEVPVQVPDAPTVAWLIGAGMVCRLVSEAPGALVQIGRSVARDNYLVIASEVAWVVFLIACGTQIGGRAVIQAAFAFLLSGFLLLGLRVVFASNLIPLSLGDLGRVTTATLNRMLAIGGLVAVAQLADFLYAPTDYILINRLISPGTVARYAPAVQIDAGLLLLVGALAAVLLPKAAIAHAAGEHATLRRYYVRGTLASAALLLAAGVAVYFLSPLIFRLWLGDPLPQTQAILPLVLVHTVVGGSAGVGRSILLGMGKVKPFAAAALAAGVANVVLSYVFVRYFDLGLKGIVYGTIVAVVGRAVLWQPWYVLRTLRREAGKTPDAASAVAATPPEPL